MNERRPGRSRARLLTAAILPMLLAAAPAIAGDEGFGPWNADVRIADENLPRSAPRKARVTTVYSAPQGGGFFLIRFFQVAISPQDGPNCRFHPTCSQYGRIAVERFGLIPGSALAGDRLLRCNPFTPPGDDAVPASILGK